MSMEFKITNRNHYLWLYFLIMSVIFFGTSIALVQLWNVQKDQVRAELDRTAAVSVGLVESSILIASKSVDVAVDRVNATLIEGHQGYETIYKILNSVVANYEFEEYNNHSGLLFYADQKGMIRSENSKFPAIYKDVTDRYYFQDLFFHPDRKYSIGNLVVGKTNQKITFHYSKSLKTKNGLFNGLLMQQIDADKLSETLGKVIDQKGVDIYIQDSTRKVIFAYPEKLLTCFIVPDYINFNQLKPIDASYSPFAEIDKFKRVENSPFDFVGSYHSNYYHLDGYVRMNFKYFFLSFLKRQLVLFYFLIAGVILTTFSVFQFHRHAKEIYLANSSANHDKLTGLFNRRYFDEYLPVLWRNAMREKSHISALFIDIDFFKKYNETYGHEMGDIVLQKVAKSINGCIHRPLDFSCRWGGEEFVVLLVNTNLNSALELAQKILQTIRLLKLGPGMDRQDVRVSIGVASVMVSELNFTDDIVDMADKAMFLAKQRGRDRCEVYCADSVGTPNLSNLNSAIPNPDVL